MIWRIGASFPESPGAEIRSLRKEGYLSFDGYSERDRLVGRAALASPEVVQRKFCVDQRPEWAAGCTAVTVGAGMGVSAGVGGTGVSVGGTASVGVSDGAVVCVGVSVAVGSSVAVSVAAGACVSVTVTVAVKTGVTVGFFVKVAVGDRVTVAVEQPPVNSRRPL